MQRAIQNVSKGQVIVAAVGLAGATYFSYKIAYPYTREIYMSWQKRSETDAFTVKKIEDAFKRLQAADNCHSLLKKYLTKEVKDKLKLRKTILGGTLYDIIRSGAENLDASVGVYAADAESYKLFAPLFDPIIEEYHGGFGPTDKQPPVDLGEGRTGDFPPLDPSNSYIKSTRIRCGRTLKGYPFNPLLTPDDYMIMQAKVKRAVEQFADEDLKGTYYPLEGMSKEVQEQLIKDHFLFKEGDRHLQGANACRKFF